MKEYRTREDSSVIASYVANKIKNCHNQSVGRHTEFGKAFLSYHDGEAVIELERTDKIKISGEGKILGWTNNMLSKPSSPVR